MFARRKGPKQQKKQDDYKLTWIAAALESGTKHHQYYPCTTGLPAVVVTGSTRATAGPQWSVKYRQYPVGQSPSVLTTHVSLSMDELQKATFKLFRILTFCFLFLFGTTVVAACEQPVGGFASIEGQVSVQTSGQNNWTPAGLDTALCEGDAVRAGKLSRAAISLITDAVLRLDEETTVKLVDIVPDPEKRSLVDLIAGAFQSFSRNPRRLTVNTPYLNGSIEGTEFVIRVNEASTDITVFEGTVIAANQHGEVPLGAGQSGSAAEGVAPQRRVLVKPRNEAQWSIYYPPVMVGDGAAASPVREAAELLSVGRSDRALAQLNGVIDTGNSSADAYALRAIVKLAQNELPPAREDADKAVETDPGNIPANIALSYVLQAAFQIESARDLMLQVTARNSGNALAWARLAELEMMLGDMQAANEAADRAIASDAALSRSHMVKGFATLAMADGSIAQSAFEQAIALDSSDPMSHLGRGLAMIRDGDLEGGRQELEAAVALDSNSALLRSYLGKAYFEEKRSPLDAQQYDIAKSLDANDPTPLFYNAIQLQTNNRPVEALKEVQKAIDLNEGRAVYRSRLLLDSDEAARGASLARVFSDLGFEQLALVEGWKSVNVDPSNSAGHRFLADSYASRSRHEIARVSELLQSQLLQPLSKAAIQPQTAESNLFAIGAGGAEKVSFNEFNQVFNRDGLALQTSAFTGEDSTSGGEGVLSGIHDNVAYSLGSFHYRTDGFRENANQHDDISNAFVQVELAPGTNVQVEYRKRETVRGDLDQRFFEDDFEPNLTDREKKDTYRLGLRHDLSEGSTLLMSLIHQEREGDFRLGDTPVPGGGVQIEFPDQSFSGELQHIFRSGHFNVRTGLGLTDLDAIDRTTIDFGPFVPLPPDSSTVDADIQHENAYSYADIRLSDSLTATVGLSYDSIEGNALDDDKDQANPKFGLIWRPFPGTTVRAAAFKTLKRTLATSQTLEPTQVAGFNQFFDDVNLTRAWRYGLGLDQKINEDWFAGVELSQRELTVPVQIFMLEPPPPPGPGPVPGPPPPPPLPVLQDVGWDEYMARTYLFYTPHPYVALSAEYIFERIERDVTGPDKLDIHRVPLGLRFSHPSGVSASLLTTYWEQKGQGITDFDDLFAPRIDARDDFWLVDAVVSYRLPKRRGFIEVGATNLTNEKFRYFETDFNNVVIQPSSAAFARITLAFQ